MRRMRPKDTSPMRIQDIKKEMAEKSETERSWLETLVSRMWSMEYCRQFFEVDTADVQKRLVGAVRVSSMFFDIIDEKGADLYVPIWNGITILFLMLNGASSENLPNTLFHGLIALVVVGILWPTLGYFGCKYLSDTDPESQRQDATLIKWICIYGYSLVVLTLLGMLFVPLRWMFSPGKIWGWMFFLCAFGHSAAFLGLNLWPDLQHVKLCGNKMYFSTGMFVLHGLLLLYLKVHFL